MKRMPQICSLVIILLGLATEFGWSIPQGVVIQGVLTNAAGQPLTGARAWQIQFYDARTSGNPLGSALGGTVAVAPSGRWSITLTPPAAVLNATGEIWYELGIDSASPPKGSVSSGDLFTGRTQVQSVLFSQMAANATNATMLGGRSAASFVTTSTLTTGFPAKFGDGSDGNVTILSAIPALRIPAQTVTLTRNMFYNNLTVNGTLVTNGFMIYVAGTLSGTGTITYGTGNPGSSGYGGGTGGAANTTGFFKNVAGGNGSEGMVNGDSVSVGHALGIAGGKGGDSSNGIGGSSSIIAPAFRFGILKWNTLMGMDSDAKGNNPYVSSAGGGGGAGGNGVDGGGGGASGGLVYIVANIWTGNFTIQATGGNGGEGLSGMTGDGGGGGGGVSVLIYGSKSWTGKYNLAGGASGGSGASAGSTGVFYEIPLANLL